jgi:hypothetical protein
MPHYACPGCNQLFHEPDPKAYVWCSCGQPLSAADMVDERIAPRPAEQPEAQAVSERAMDQFDRRAMVGAVYSPCFLRAIVKRKVAELNETDMIFELAVSDGDDYAAIAVQIAAPRDETVGALKEIVERSVENIAARFPRDKRLARLGESAPLKLAAAGRNSSAAPAEITAARITEPAAISQ